jgi:hypothetical protein
MAGSLTKTLRRLSTKQPRNRLASSELVAPLGVNIFIIGGENSSPILYFLVMKFIDERGIEWARSVK